MAFFQHNFHLSEVWGYIPTPLTYLFIQQKFIEHLLDPRPHARPMRYNYNLNSILVTYIPVLKF